MKLAYLIVSIPNGRAPKVMASSNTLINKMFRDLVIKKLSRVLKKLKRFDTRLTVNSIAMKNGPILT